MDNYKNELNENVILIKPYEEGYSVIRNNELIEVNGLNNCIKFVKKHYPDDDYYVLGKISNEN